MQRREFLKTMAGASVCSMLCSSCSFLSENDVVGSEFLYKSKANLPKSIKLEACSLCQLNCPACWMRLYEDYFKKVGCFGYLKFKDFKHLIDDNPQIKEIELSKNGEIFLNPELDKIIEYAHKKGVKLTAKNGVNLNTLSDEMAENLVKYQFKDMVVSIDGATPDIYKIYRRGGDFNKVISNIKKINEFKKKYNSKYPILTYKFIIFNHNIEDIPLAKKLAQELDMKVKFEQNIQPWYAPLSKEQKERAEKMSGIVLNDTACAEHSLKEYKNGNNDWFFCQALFDAPQIDWNGNLLGCCMFVDRNFGVNVFKDGLLNTLNNPKILYAKRMLTDFSTLPKKEVLCTDCSVYELLKKENYELRKYKKV